MIKIIKENKLNIPIGTILNSQSFHYEPYGDTWKTISYYIYEDELKNLCVLRENAIYPSLLGYYKNIIILDNLQLGEEGEEYWKVFTDKKESYFHKLEVIDGKHCPAICYTPYRDIIQFNTNLHSGSFQRRFKTELEAIVFINSISNDIKRREL